MKCAAKGKKLPPSGAQISRQSLTQILTFTSKFSNIAKKKCYDMTQIFERTPRILVVDDDDSFRELIQKILSNEGFVVDTASDGDLGIAAARRNSYDLILLDLKMPNVDGMQTLKVLKPELPNTDFIVVTGYSDVNIAVELLKLGAKEYLTKPVEPTEFIRQVKSALRAHMAEVRLNEVETEFSSLLLHDLRSPLSLAISAIEFLKKEQVGSVTPEQRQIFEQVASHLNKMDMMLRDMIDLTLFESGKIEIEKLPTNLDELIPAVCDRFKTQAAAKNISFQLHITHNVPTLEVDPERIGHVLNNLLDNGIKYTNDGGTISISLTTGPRQENGVTREYVEISISDSGVGISKDELPLIFDKYKDVLTGKTSSQKTTGLGLAICKSIIAAHNGLMTAMSEPGKGSTFTIYLPTETMM
jgi:signal transduction histidine kinase